MPFRVFLLLTVLLLITRTAEASEVGLFGQPIPTPTQVAPNPTTPPSDSGGGGSEPGGSGDGSGSSGAESSGGPGGAVTADINSSGKVDIFDLSILLNSWNKSGQGDINGSGVVDIFDLSVLLSNWTK